MDALPAGIIIVAPTEVGVADQLAAAIQQHGIAVTRVTTPEELATAPSLPCAVVLTPATRAAPVSAVAAMETRFPQRLPVFAEPMVLPGGVWTAPPLLLRTSVAETAPLVLRALMASPRTAVQADPHAERQRARMLWWHHNQRQFQALAVILGVLVVGFVCRLCYVVALSLFVHFFGG